MIFPVASMDIRLPAHGLAAADQRRRTARKNKQNPRPPARLTGRDCGNYQKIRPFHQIRLVRSADLCFHHRPGSQSGQFENLLSENDPSMLPDNVIPFEEARPVSRFPGSPMKSHLVDKASEIVTDPLVLINLVSQRVRQLNSGRSPLIPTRPSMGVADIALTEIIEGKIKLVEKAEA
jgi:DNA-directed RNA polymerase subunit omega